MSHTSKGFHPMYVQHTANAAVGIPVIAAISGVFHGALADAALLAGFILYSLQIYDWIRKRWGK